MEQLLCTVQNPFLQITYLCRTLPVSKAIILFQFFVQVFWNLVLPASNSSELILLNRIIIKYYHTLFALKTQNCLDNFTWIITDLSIVFWLDYSGVCFCFNTNYCFFRNNFRWRLVSCWDQSIDFHCKAIVWFLYGVGHFWKKFPNILRLS